MKPQATEPRYHAHLPDGRMISIQIPPRFYDPHASFPYFYSGGGWQRSDAEHPIGGGVHGYRVAYKTVKLFVLPDFYATVPNLRPMVGQRSVERGGMRVRPDATPARRWNQRIIPEYGRVSRNDEGFSYDGTPDMQLQYECWEETLGRVSFVEIIVRLDDQDTGASASTIMNAGRRAVASL
jgi:hypothetical protein